MQERCWQIEDSELGRAWTEGGGYKYLFCRLSSRRPTNKRESGVGRWEDARVGGWVLIDSSANLGCGIYSLLLGRRIL